ncbi:MAG: hypothetical protein FWE95_00320 [Planctomycetaceae bacterium]|nr:hypothetical protein [Planctomycetaceae bacterium]
MRRILLTLLIVSVVGASAFAVWNPFSRTTTPTFNEAELRAALASLTPTEAEAKAIAALRKKTSIQLARQQQQINAPPQIMTTGGNLELPVEANPVGDSRVQIAIEYRFFSGPTPLIETITGHPAMSWSTLPVATPLVSPSTPPGTFSRSESLQMPMHVRYLENNKIEKFFILFQSLSTSSVMEAPRFILRNGEEGTVNDITTVPFVTSVLPIEADGAVGYQPIIQLLDTGQTYTTKVTLLQDGSYRLASQMEFTSLSKVDQPKLINEESVPEPRSLFGNRNRTETKRGVTVQAPSFNTFRVNIPDIVIPDGMSLLIAFPGYTNNNPSGGMFMLITLRKVEAIEFASDDVRQIQGEWERFWKLDEPHDANPYSRQ